MRKLDLLTNAEQIDVLYSCAYLSWQDVHTGIIPSSEQLTSALSYGQKFGILQNDYSTIYATVFPTNGPPQKP